MSGNIVLANSSSVWMIVVGKRHAFIFTGPNASVSRVSRQMCGLHLDRNITKPRQVCFLLFWRRSKTPSIRFSDLLSVTRKALWITQRLSLSVSRWRLKVSISKYLLRIAVLLKSSSLPPKSVPTRRLPGLCNLLHIRSKESTKGQQVVTQQTELPFGGDNFRVAR